MGNEGAAQCRLTVFFEPPFWVGVYERQEGGCYTVSKMTFGAEPKEYEVYAFVLKTWSRWQFSPAVEAQGWAARQSNPKRRQREIRRQLQSSGVGTKAQQALSLQREQNKCQRKAGSRAQRQEEEARRYAMRQQKKKEKHRGR